MGSFEMRPWQTLRTAGFITAAQCVAYQQRKLTHLYQWQFECLNERGVADHGRNLLYTAPTSGGKSAGESPPLLRRSISGTRMHAVCLQWPSC